MKLNRLINLSAAAAALACSGPGLLLAQPVQNSSIYIMPSLTIVDPDSRFNGDKNLGGLGLRLGKAITPSWDIQVGGSMARATNNGQRFEQSSLGVDALYLFNRSNFRPFLLAGVGAENDKLPNARQTSPYINLGLGFQLALSEQWFMQADLRRSRAYQRDDNLFGADRTNSNTLNFGVSYYFDKPAPPVVAQYNPPPAPEPVVTPPPPPPPPPARFERVTLSATELFEFDSADLRMPQTKLDEIVQALSGGQYTGNITVTGYTDRIGADSYNLKLSQRRADAVKSYLASKGVSANRLTAIGKGKANPVVNCQDRNQAALIKCLAPNRRVEVEEIVIERRVN